MKFDIILADPPWEFRVWSRKGASRGALVHYPTMNLDDIANLPILELTKDNTALFLWSTYTVTPETFYSVSNWNNTEETIEIKEPMDDIRYHIKPNTEKKRNLLLYKTIAFNWIKLNKKWMKWFPSGRSYTFKRLDQLFFMGMGYYMRANPEPCYLFVKGDMPVARRDQRVLVFSPIRNHSQKPEEVYRRIEAVYPREKYPDRLELFASKYSAPLAEKYGYIPLGYDVDGRDIRDSIKDYL